MGSLLPGWDSDISESIKERENSLTNEEIEKFWEVNQKHQKARPEPAEPRIEASSSTLETQCEVDLDKACSKDDWWTRSNWAFLNEKPQEDVQKSSNTYNSQFHIARTATAN
ncbi:hypothetical protein Sjap_023562 [Stephania japonica]|uniref:Uncharacterized protein n=1 Tax=Stephania japonica TaxID=461633 RepID=A0AAP0EBU5_9MAGN